jgi:hypothetical protein
MTEHNAHTGVYTVSDLVEKMFGELQISAFHKNFLIVFLSMENNSKNISPS